MHPNFFSYIAQKEPMQALLLVYALHPLLAKEASAAGCACAHQDPHLTLAHGGRADFRGKNNTLYNFISSHNASVAIKTEDASFYLDKLLVHG